jgi:glycosyltransferase involved in cell wall biosynthesis
MQPLLSILIPTLRSRADKLSKLLNRLEFQRQTKPVQLLWIGDNKSITVGEKRNMLLAASKGEWVCFVDDDDEVSDRYLELILDTIKNNPTKKLITFYGNQTDNGIPTLDFKYSRAYGRNHKPKIDGKYWKVMYPDHLCVWKKDIVKVVFPDKQLGEDHDWAREMSNHYSDDDIIEIQEYLYHYHFNRGLTECR